MGLTQLKDLAYTVVPPQHEKKRDDDSFKVFFVFQSGAVFLAICYTFWG